MLLFGVVLLYCGWSCYFDRQFFIFAILFFVYNTTIGIYCCRDNLSTSIIGFQEKIAKYYFIYFGWMYCFLRIYASSKTSLFKAVAMPVAEYYLILQINSPILPIMSAIAFLILLICSIYLGVTKSINKHV